MQLRGRSGAPLMMPLTTDQLTQLLEHLELAEVWCCDHVSHLTVKVSGSLGSTFALIPPITLKVVDTILVGLANDFRNILVKVVSKYLLRSR
jgi:hypothetical protein